MNSIEKSQIHLAKLFIPTLTNERYELEAVKWRLNLIRQEKVYSFDDLVTLLKKASNETIASEEKKNLFKSALCNDLTFDEYNEAILFVISFLKNIETKPYSFICEVDHMSKVLSTSNGISKEEYIKNNKEYLDITRRNLKQHRVRLINTEVKKMRAVLAFKEIVAMINPDKMVPHLIKITPKYLSSDLTQKWIRQFRYFSHFGSDKEKTVADKKLKELFNAIKGDKRGSQKRNYSYWKLSLIYYDLSGYIVGFRKQKKEGKLDKELFEIYCKLQKINNIHKNCILNSNEAAHNLALEIMINQKLIPSPKAYKDIQPHVSKLQKKHFNGNILGIARELIPVIVDFLDVPKKHPDVLFKANIMDSLEEVRI